METVLVSVSGPAFSFLMYENAKSEFDQEGFLLGEFYEKQTKTITDNEQDMVKLERGVKINCAVPCPHTCYFYDSIGKVNMDKLKSLLGDEISRVVAWYKFRHSPGFKLTLREKVIHKQLANSLQTPLDLFTTCLLTKEVSDNRSTHLFSQTFVRYSNSMYQPLPMHIVNLSDASNSYRTSQQVSGAFKKLVNSAGIDLKKSQGFKVVGEIHNALQKEIESVLGNLDDVQELFKLEQEVKELRKAVALKTEKKAVENNNIDNGGDVEVENQMEGVSDEKPTEDNIRVVKEKKTREQHVRACRKPSYAQATQGGK